MLFKNKNFLILFIGVIVKSLGQSIYSIGGMLIVLGLTGDVLYSGITYFIISIPGVVGFMLAPLANYVNYKKGLIGSEILQSILLISIFYFNYIDSLNVYYVITVMFLISLIAQFTEPIETTLLPMIVGEKNVVLANSYVNTIRESLSVLFIAGAGIIFAIFGTAETIIITAICHAILAILYTFFSLQNKFNTSSTQKYDLKSMTKKYTNDLKMGFNIIKGTFLPKIVKGATAVNLFAGAMIATLPAFSLSQGGSEKFYGFYMASVSVGLILGAISAPKIKHLPYGKLVIGSSILTGVSWIISSVVSVWPSIVFISIGCIGIGIINILIFSIIQQKIPLEFVGRVIALVSSMSALSMPVGGLIGGLVGSTLGVHYPFLFGGLGMIIFALYWVISKSLVSLPRIDDVKIVSNDFNLTQKSV